MKIGMFTDTYHRQINGVITAIDAWKAELERRGHEVVVVYPRSGKAAGGVPLPSIDFKFYKGYAVGLPYGPMPSSLKDLDIVHTHTQFTVGAYGAYIASKLKIPRITSYHTPVEQYVNYMIPGRILSKAAVRIYNRWERRYLAGAFYITAPTAAAKRYLQSKSGLRVVVLTNGVDLSRFRRTSPLYRMKGRTIGFSGRHSYEKHLEDLIAIADDFDGNILITGDGPAHNYFVNLAKGKKNVKFFGFIPNGKMAAFYSSLDALVLPSTAETEGLVILEANACGTPAVGARAAGLKTTIKEGENGYLYKPGDTADLKEKIEKLYKNRARLQESALSVAQSHSLQRSTDELLELYETAKPKRVRVNRDFLYVPLSMWTRLIYKAFGRR